MELRYDGSLAIGIAEPGLLRVLMLKFPDDCLMQLLTRTNIEFAVPGIDDDFANFEAFLMAFCGFSSRTAHAIDQSLVESIWRRA